MSKRFHREQARAFKNYACKSKIKDTSDLRTLFTDWAESKDISGVDKQEIWRLARNFAPEKIIIISEDSEEFVRLSALLDFLLVHDSTYFNKLAEKYTKNVLDKT